MFPRCTDNVNGTHSAKAQGPAEFLQDIAALEQRANGCRTNLRYNFQTPEEMIAFIQDHPRIRLLEVCFTDVAGRWHHCTFSVETLDLKLLQDGFGFDGSSIPMFQKINESDMSMKADPTTCWLDPFAAFPTLHVTASIFDARGHPYERCPRQILIKARNLLKDLNVADEVLFGPEMEFFLFQSARFSVAPHAMQFNLDSDEAYWNYNTPTEFKRRDSADILPPPNLGHRANLKEGYMTSRPVDKSSDVRSEMLLTLEQLGIRSEKHHHEVATCQMEINIRAQNALVSADNVQVLKYVVKNVAERHGKTATFMPKPLANDNGSGMHCNQSIVKDGRNVFFDPTGPFENLSETAFHYMAGILAHCRSLLAIACPTTNSYRRLVPDFEAAIHISYSAGNRSTAIRVPTFTNEKTKRIEFRSPDASCCPYLAFSAMMLAGLDGIRRKLEPPPVASGNLFDENNPQAAIIKRLPVSLGDALEALREDHDYLTQDGVFTEKFIQDFIEFKYKEVRELRCCPHPREFMLYYGC